ncbi:hypothetical protein EC50959_3173 [Escherichia coli 5.0959]|nr:hypothetical protein EC50959_3173 [Escherichia coli 5.0959]
MNRPLTDFGGKTSIFSHPVYLFLRKFSLQDSRGGSLPEGTLGQWVTAARKGLGTPGSRTVAELESEILQLRKALNEARLERDILKKQQRILHRSR